MPTNDPKGTEVTVGTGKYSPTQNEVSQITDLGTFGKADYAKLQASFSKSPVSGDSNNKDPSFEKAENLFEYFLGAVFARGNNATAKSFYSPTAPGSDFVGNTTVDIAIRGPTSLANNAPDISVGGFGPTDSPSDASLNPPPATKFYPNVSSPQQSLPAPHIQGPATDVVGEANRSLKQFGTGDASGANPATTTESIAGRLD